MNLLETQFKINKSLYLFKKKNMTFDLPLKRQKEIMDVCKIFPPTFLNGKISEILFFS